MAKAHTTRDSWASADEVLESEVEVSSRRVCCEDTRVQ